MANSNWRRLSFEFSYPLKMSNLNLLSDCKSVIEEVFPNCSISRIDSGKVDLEKRKVVLDELQKIILGRTPDRSDTIASATVSELIKVLSDEIKGIKAPFSDSDSKLLHGVLQFRGLVISKCEELTQFRNDSSALKVILSELGTSVERIEPDFIEAIRSSANAFNVDCNNVKTYIVNIPHGEHLNIITGAKVALIANMLFSDAKPEERAQKMFEVIKKFAFRRHECTLPSDKAEVYRALWIGELMGNLEGR